MKALLRVAVVVAGSVAALPALAADLPARMYAKAAPPIAAVYDWTGFYIGANGGYGRAHKCWDLVARGATPVPGNPEGCHDADGGTAGGQIAYRWQTQQVVFGIEGQGNWADFRGQNVSNVFGFNNRTRIDSFGMLTGQIGMAFNTVLLYVKGGGAVVNDRYAGIAPLTGALINSAKETRGGGVIGAGIEFAVTQNVTIGVNYDHMILGNRTLAFVTPAGTNDRSDRIRQDVDMVTARVNWHWGGPVVAKY